MEFKHWCGNCQIRVYAERHYGYRLDWMSCPYVCEYATAMRCSINPAQVDAKMEKARIAQYGYIPIKEE